MLDGDREMPRHPTYVPHGVIPAVILPFHDDLSIDEASFRKHLRDVTRPRGFRRSPSTRIRPKSRPAPSTSRGASSRSRSEIGDKTADRQRHLGRRQPGGRAPRQDGDRRRRLGAAGVSAGAVHMARTPEMAVEHFKRIADASDLPLIAFQYPLATARATRTKRILRMIEDIPTLKAIKDWAGTRSSTSGMSARCSTCRGR